MDSKGKDSKDTEPTDEKMEKMIKLAYMNMLENITKSQSSVRPYIMDRISQLEARIDRLEAWKERGAAIIRPTDFTKLFESMSPSTGFAPTGADQVLVDFDKFLVNYIADVSKDDYKSKDAILAILANVRTEFLRIKRVHTQRFGGVGGVGPEQ